MLGFGGLHAAYKSRAADELASEGLSAEVLDLRSLAPLGAAALLARHARGDGEATPRCGIASDVAALRAGRGFGHLQAPVKRVTAPHAPVPVPVPVPFARPLEDAYMPSAAKIVAAVREQRRQQR